MLIDRERILKIKVQGANFVLFVFRPKNIGEIFTRISCKSCIFDVVLSRPCEGRGW